MKFLQRTLSMFKVCFAVLFIQFVLRASVKRPHQKVQCPRKTTTPIPCKGKKRDSDII